MCDSVDINFENHRTSPLIIFITLDGVIIAIQNILRLKNRKNNIIPSITVLDDSFNNITKRYIMYFLIYLFELTTPRNLSLGNLSFIFYIIIVIFNEIIINVLSIDRIYDDLTTALTKYVYYIIRSVILKYLYINFNTHHITWNHDDLKKLYKKLADVRIIIKIFWVSCTTLIQNRIYGLVFNGNIYNYNIKEKTSLINDCKRDGLESLLSRRKIIRLINIFYYDTSYAQGITYTLSYYSQLIIDSLVISYAYYNILSLINNIIILKLLLTLIICYISNRMNTRDILISGAINTFTIPEISALYFLTFNIRGNYSKCDILTIIRYLIFVVINNRWLILKFNVFIIALHYKYIICIPSTIYRIYDTNILLVIFLTSKQLIVYSLADWLHNNTRDIVDEEYLISQSPINSEYKIDDTYVNEVNNKNDENIFISEIDNYVIIDNK